MILDLTHFSPATALAGGLVIGLASALFVLGSGRIAGISGILGGLLDADRGERAWRVAFTGGMLIAPWAFRLVAPLPTATVSASPPILVLAGLLVGIGTRYASGCTSGHGVCGISRGSARSVVATIAFMAAGFLTVLVSRHLVKI